MYFPRFCLSFFGRFFSSFLFIFFLTRFPTDFVKIDGLSRDVRFGTVGDETRRTGRLKLPSPFIISNRQTTFFVLFLSFSVARVGLVGLLLLEGCTAQR